MKVTPLGDRVLVKVEDADQQTAGGIYIPDTAQEKTQNGVVVAIGDDEEIKVKVKDKIVYDKYAGTTIKVADEEQLILKAADILAVISA
jgi:chaperonin GroES